MEYPITEGKNGPIIHIAEGLRVSLNQYGSWELTLKSGGHRKKKAFGKGLENQEKAIRAGELLAAKLGISLQEESERGFAGVVQEWLSHNRHRWTPGTVERYEGVVRHFILPPLGMLPLSRIDRSRVKRFLVEVSQIRSPKTAELVHAVLSGIFTEAIDLGYTNQNPTHGLLKKILPPKHKRTQQAPDPFNKKELEQLLIAAGDHLPEPFPLIIETMALSGMRLGEALAMRREHLDIANAQYMVSETTRQGRYGLPKTGKRLIDLPESLVAKLESRIRTLRTEALAAGGVVDYLFPSITQRMVQRAMQRACLAAKHRVRSPHDLRHTYASLLLMDHYSPAYVQKQLGHHSITITVDIYGHWIPGEGKKDLEKTLRCPVKAPGHRTFNALS